MKEKIQNKLYKMWLFREEAKTGNLFNNRNSALQGAIELAEVLGFKVEFNPLAIEGENPFKVKEMK